VVKGSSAFPGMGLVSVQAVISSVVGAVSLLQLPGPEPDLASRNLGPPPLQLWPPSLQEQLPTPLPCTWDHWLDNDPTEFNLLPGGDPNGPNLKICAKARQAGAEQRSI